MSLASHAVRQVSSVRMADYFSSVSPGPWVWSTGARRSRFSTSPPIVLRRIAISMYVCLSVCSHISTTTSRHYLYMLAIATARSAISDDNTVCYVFKRPELKGKMLFRPVRQ